MAERKLTPREEFDKALREGEGAFGVALGDAERARLGDYFELVGVWNKHLHLVAPCPPAEFATRHVLESLVAVRYMSEGAAVVDVGSGGGLPVIPCLVARPDLRAVLFEASRKKAVFLREALSALGAREAARVVAERFEKAGPPAADYLTCRALERFTQMLPVMFEWASRVPVLLLFGGEGLREEIESAGLESEAVHMAGSERRFLFVVRRRTKKGRDV